MWKVPAESRSNPAGTLQSSAAEKAGEENIDRAASYFATVMSVVMAMKEDEWTEELQKMGYQLGKFIYLCDAYEDAEEDIKAGRYNVFCTHVDQRDLMLIVKVY